MNITLDDLHWIHTIGQPQRDVKNQAIFQSKWRILARLEMFKNGKQQFNFLGGEKPKELIFELNLMSIQKNSDEIKKHKLENSAGALTCLGDKYSNNFIIGGIIVLSDEFYNDMILSAQASGCNDAQMILSLEGLESTESRNSIPTWDNVRNNKLKVTNVQTIFHYGQAPLSDYPTRRNLGAWLKSL